MVATNGRGSGFPHLYIFVEQKILICVVSSTNKWLEKGVKIVNINIIG